MLLHTLIFQINKRLVEKTKLDKSSMGLNKSMDWFFKSTDLSNSFEVAKFELNFVTKLLYTNLYHKNQLYQYGHSILLDVINEFEWLLSFRATPSQEDREKLSNQYQKALLLHCHIAYKQGHGELFEISANKLFVESYTTHNTFYHYKAISHLFLICYEKNDLESASLYIQALLNIAEKNEYRNAIHYRQLSMVNMFLISRFSSEVRNRFYAQRIQNVFWKPFDIHKQVYQEKCENSGSNALQLNKLNNVLIKDFKHLFSMKIIERLYGLNPEKLKKRNETLLQYMYRQIKALFDKDEKKINSMYQIILDIVSHCKKDGFIFVGKGLFKEQTPRILINDVQFAELFPEDKKNDSLESEVKNSSLSLMQPGDLDDPQNYVDPYLGWQ